MVTLQIQKLIDSWWKISIGDEVENWDSVSWEQYIDQHLTTTYYITKDGNRLHWLDDEIEHESLHNYFEDEESEFEFNQDMDYENEIRSPGWIRYQKKLKND